MKTIIALLLSVSGYCQYVAPSYSFVDYSHQIGLSVGYVDTTFSYNIFLNKGSKFYTGFSTTYLLRPIYEGKTDIGLGIKAGMYGKNIIVRPFMETWIVLHKYATFKVDVCLFTRFDFSFNYIIPITWHQDH